MVCFELPFNFFTAKGNDLVRNHVTNIFLGFSQLTSQIIGGLIAKCFD